jgi:hypothetical protein
VSLSILHTGRKGELRQINRYCIFLRVISVSDITDFDGTRINQTSYDCVLYYHFTNIRWPNQQRPTKGGWTIWRKFLHSISDTNQYLFNLLENGLISPSGTITANGSLPTHTDPLSIKSAINGYLTHPKVEVTHKSLSIPRYCFMHPIFTPKHSLNATTLLSSDVMLSKSSTSPHKKFTFHVPGDCNIHFFLFILDASLVHAPAPNNVSNKSARSQESDPQVMVLSSILRAIKAG